MRGASLTLKNESVMLRSDKCQKQYSRRDGACAECKKLASKAAVQKHVCKQSYVVDLCALAFNISHRSDKDVDLHLKMMRKRDYYKKGWAGQDLDKLMGSPSKLEQVRSIVHRLQCIPSWRLNPALKALLQKWLVPTPSFHSGDVESSAHASLVQQLAGAVREGRCRSEDLALAAKVAAGRLRGDSLVQGLVTSFLNVFKSDLQHQRYKTTGAHMGFAAVEDALHRLGQTDECRNLMKVFCVNPRKLPKLNIFNAMLPQHFLSMESPERLRESIQCAFGHLKLGQGRAFLLFDETVHAQDFDLLRSVHNGADAYIGGHWSRNPEEDYARLDPLQYDHHNLPLEKLARLALAFVFKRSDSNKYCMDVCLLPRPRGQASASEMLHLVTSVLQQATAVQAGVPPQGTACDAATCNKQVAKAFAGQLPQARMREHQFLADCRLIRPGFSFWPYAFVVHGEGQHLMTCFLGGFHLQKRFSLQFAAGSKKICLGSVHVDLACMLGRGLPRPAFVLREPQSDKHSAARMAPCYTPRVWASLGTHVYILFGALISAITCSAAAFTVQQRAMNAFSLHYLVLLHAASNRKRWGPDWELHSLALTTLRNISITCAGAVATCKTVVEPAALQELRIETHFGNVKSHVRGTASLRDLLFGTAKEHARQACELKTLTAKDLPTAFTSQPRDPMSDADLAQCSRQALAVALQFHCCISEDLAVSEAYDDLQTFWNKRGGAKLFGQLDEADLEAAACLDDAASDDEAEWNPDAVEVTGQALEENEEKNEGIAFAQEGTLLESLQGHAALNEELQKYLEILGDANMPSANDANQPDKDDRRAAAAKKHFLDMFPDEADEGAPQDDGYAAVPKTLLELLKPVLKKQGAEFDLGEATALGTKACLLRVHALIGGIRRMSRLCRLEEGLLSLAALEEAQVPMNQHNLRQHELALARQAASLSRTRVSRSAAWAAAQAAFVAKVKTKNAAASGEDPGLIPVAAYKPQLDPKVPQVLLIRDAEQGARLCLVLSVYRGSVVRKATSKQLGQVRVSKPVADELPAECVRVVHVAPLAREGDHYVSSCAEAPLRLDPVNCVQGQLTVKNVCLSATRVHIFLSKASEEALRQIEERRLSIPKLTEDADGGDDVPLPKGVGDAAASSRKFDDRSFMRRSLEDSVPAFMTGLKNQYAEMQLKFLDDDGVLAVGKEKYTWAEILKAVPGYFLQTLKDQRDVGANG